VQLTHEKQVTDVLSQQPAILVFDLQSRRRSNQGRSNEP
jgi:hypothetical protein